MYAILVHLLSFYLFIDTFILFLHCKAVNQVDLTKNKKQKQ